MITKTAKTPAAYRKGVIHVFEIGDYVIKAHNGICRIEDILHLDLPNADKDRLYYLLIPLENKNSKLYVPTDTLERHSEYPKGRGRLDRKRQAPRTGL